MVLGGEEEKLCVSEWIGFSGCILSADVKGWPEIYSQREERGTRHHETMTQEIPLSTQWKNGIKSKNCRVIGLEGNKWLRCFLVTEVVGWWLLMWSDSGTMHTPDFRAAPGLWRRWPGEFRGTADGHVECVY